MILKLANKFYKIKLKIFKHVWKWPTVSRVPASLLPTSSSTSDYCNPNRETTISYN
jgi:hypothetical protein